MTLRTPWADLVDPDAPLPEHPRPQLVRAGWRSLNGRWRYAITPFAASDPLAVPDPLRRPQHWAGDIVVPFSPETELSQVGRVLEPGEALWYRRTFSLPRPATDGERVLLHFGAVDQSCRVAVDGVEVGGHTGGYLPFTLDVTAALGDGPEHDLTVAVRDVTDAAWLSRGKQSRRPGGIWYTPTSGIWQSVWLEIVPRVAVDGLTLTPDLESGAVVVTVQSLHAAPGQEALVEITESGRRIASAAVRVGEPVPVGWDGPVRTWSPEDPFLYDVRVTLGNDRVDSYVGMRSFGVGPDASGTPRLLLNGEPYLHVGLLDQGYWPESAYTAPTDEALAHDVRLAKRLGFTMLRKHIKVEPLRWYHHCDRLGILVWQDAVNGGTRYRPLVITAPVVGTPPLDDREYARFGRADEAGRRQAETELRDMVEHLRSVVSLAMWVPFNEGWGQFDAARIAAEVAQLDPSRTVDHASGWHDQGGGDLRSLHVYFRPVRVPRRPDGRALAVTEYGGYSLPVPGHTWSGRVFGYRRYRTREGFTRALERLHSAEIEPAIARGLAATVYTQLSDVEEEANGLVTYDRRIVKVPEERMRAINDRLRNAAVAASAPTPRPGGSVTEPELTGPVTLTAPTGGLNRAAVGWARQPIVDTTGIPGRPWGRNKRWEYWNVVTPTHILALTVSSIDYAAVHEVWVFDRRTERVWQQGATVLPARGVELPATLGDGPARARAKGLAIDIEEVPGGTRLRARIADAEFDVIAALPPGHERLAVVVPWSDTRFQYTVKDVARPAHGTVTTAGRTHEVPAGESWAVLDHGRGRWPYDIGWNWGAGSGVSHGRVIGIQVGGEWTAGTGVSENAFFVDGRLHKIHGEVVWEYDIARWREPWRVHGGGLDATFVPFFDKVTRTNLAVLSSATDQCFGHWSGTFRTAEGETVPFEGIVGWAEEVHNRW